MKEGRRKNEQKVKQKKNIKTNEGRKKFLKN